MTRDRDFKRRIRARMEKTGESYTAARAHLLEKSPPPLPDDYEAVAGMSDAAVEKATGRGWPEWTKLLDRARAATMEHRGIVEHLREQHGVPGWWCQMIAVGYERLRGLREIGQRRDGGFEISKSKTVGVGVTDLWRAFSDASIRRRWLPDEELTIRTANEPKTMRMRLSDDAPLDAYFTPKGDAKATVTLQVRGLSDREAADAAKSRWGARLEALADVLAGR